MARRYRHRRKTRLDKVECILLLIIGLLMGTVFVFGMGYWNAAIEPAEAISVTAQYEGYEPHYRRVKGSALRKKVNVVDLLFTDHDRLTLDSSCINQDLTAEINKLSPGTTLELLVHPNGGETILSITSGGRILLSFDEAMEYLSVERRGFLLLGLFCYILAGISACKLITGSYRKYYR